MIILAIDTALGACSAGLFDTASGRAVLRCQIMQRGHAEALMPMIRDVMAEAGLAFSRIERIGVTVGPGSFTGLRVGISAARGLALATGRPAIGVGTLEAYAHGFERGAHEGALAIALDARKGEIYFQLFKGGQALCLPCVLAPERAAMLLPDTPLTIAGSGAALLAGAAGLDGRSGITIAALPPGPDPEAIARLAAIGPVPETAPLPLYLRPPDAKPQPSAGPFSGNAARITP